MCMYMHTYTLIISMIIIILPPILDFGTLELKPYMYKKYKLYISSDLEE